MYPSRPYALPALDAIMASPMPSPTTTDTSTSEPSLISSTQGKNIVQDSATTLQGIKGEPLQPEVVQAVSPEGPGNAEASKDFVTYVNPETGQESTLRGDAITDENKKKMQEQGYTESTSDLSKVALNKADTDMKAAESSLDSTMAQLESTAISSNELRATTSRIKQAYRGRMQQMREVNRRREQTLNTLGVRLGSRYTGGSGGVFGGILSEEERQGVMRVTEIEGEMQAAISQAEKAAKEHNYTVFTKMVEKAQEKYDDKVKAFADLEKAQKQAQADMETEARTVADQADILEQIQAGEKDPVKIFTALGGKVPYDTIVDITKTLPVPESTKPIALGSGDILVNPSTGEVIARGSKAGGGTGNITGVSSFGGVVAPVGAPAISGLGATYSSSTPEAQMVIDDILNKIPAQLRNTEKETALKMEQIRKQLAAGYSYQQIVDRLSGFSLQGNADKAIGNALYNAALGTDIDVGQLASLLNRGAGEQAMTTVENKQLENVQAFFAPVDKARSTVKQADVVLKLLNDPTFPKDALGSFDGRVFKVTKFFGLNDTQRQKVQQLESALQLLAAPIRVEVAGTAATDSEMGKISAFQSDILDQPDTIKTQVEALRSAVLNFHNEARSQRGLPQVNEQQLIDNKARLGLYRSAGAADNAAVSSTLSNGDLLNSGAWNGSTPAKPSTAGNKDFFNGL